MPNRKQLFIWAAAALWAGVSLYAGWNYFSAALAYPLWSTLLAAFIGLSAYAGGSRLLRALGTDFGNSFPLEAAASLTAGLSLLALGMTAAGFFSVFHPATAALLCGAGLWFGRDRLPALGAISFKGLNPWLLLPSIALLALALLAAWAPVQQYDSLVYHLPLIRHYIDAGGIVPVPFNLYSHFPQNGEMLLAPGILFNSELTSQLTSWLCLLACGLWVYGYASKYDRTTALLALLITVSHTSLMIISATTYVEAPIAMWTTGGVISLLLWTESPEPRSGWPWILLAGLCAGSALAAKYYSGITCAVLFAMALSYCFTLGRFSLRKPRLAQAVAFGFLCALLFMPWAIKNIHEVGNPVFPFFYRLFDLPGVTRAEAHGYFNMITEYGHRRALLKELVSFPLVSLSSPGRYGGGMDVLGILGWELLFASVPLMVWSARSKRWAKWLGIYLVAHAACWFVTGTVLRFLLVIAPLAAILAANGLVMLYREKPALRLPVAAGLLLFLAGRLFLFAYEQCVTGAPLPLVGLESRGDYLRRTVPYYDCAMAAGETPDNSRILLAGEARYYYFNRPVMPTNLYRANDFVQYSNEAGDFAALNKTLKDKGFTHIVYEPKEFNRLRQYLTLSLTQAGQKNWDALLQNSVKIYEGRACALYELK